MMVLITALDWLLLLKTIDTFQTRWTELAEKHDLDLVLCVAAAQRRGMVDEDEMKRNSKDANNIAGKFRISGLGQLIEAGIQADRMITFGD